MASSTCEVKDGSGSYQSTTNGVNVTPANTITIRLVSAAGVSSWQISCVYADETTTPATINAGLVVDSVAKTATFTAPDAAKALIFQSRVNGGIGTDGTNNDSLTTTFGVFTLTSGGKRVAALNQKFEGNATYGWTADFNDIVRNGTGGSSGGGASGRTIKAMADADQTASTGDVAGKAIIETTGAVTEARKLTVPDAATDAASYLLNVINSCSDTFPNTRANTTPYAIGDIVEASPRNVNVVWKATSAGTSGGSQPANFTTATLAGATASDGSVNWVSVLRCRNAFLTVQTSSTSRVARIPPGTRALLQVTTEGVQLVAGGYYDPTHFGARLDGLHDDLPAFQAMHSAVPLDGGEVRFEGQAWFSDTWRISKPIRLNGAHASSYGTESTIRSAPGKTAIRIDGNATSLDGAHGARTRIGHISFYSQVLIHWNADGSDAGQGIRDVFVSGGAVRKGACFIKISGGGITDKFFRCTDTGAGDFPGVFGASEPAWNTTVGGTTSHNGMTFVTEKFPVVRANTTGYSVGDRVFADKDNRFYFECETAGTSASSPPNELAGGDSIISVCVNHTYADDSVVWRCRLHTAVFVAAPYCRVEHSYAQGFTGPVITALGQASPGGLVDAPTISTQSNFFQLDGLDFIHCGAGPYMGGNDGNAYTIRDCFGNLIGKLLPTPNVASAASGVTTLGGHGLIDLTQGGGKSYGTYHQSLSGRDFFAGATAKTDLLGCSAETVSTGGGWIKSTAVARIFGGSLAVDNSSPGFYVKPAAPGETVGIGITERLDYGVTPTQSAQLTDKSSRCVYLFWNSAMAAGAFFGWKWAAAAAGFYSLRYSGSVLVDALYMTTAVASGYGPGLAGFTHGHFLGNPATVTPIWRGRHDSRLSSTVRYGKRRKGDAFYGVTTEMQVCDDTNRYMASPWASGAVTSGNATSGIPPTMVTPTTSTGLACGGEQIWQCTTSGTTSGSEPSWPASPTVGVTTQSDGSAVWTFVGTTPPTTNNQVSSTGKALANFRQLEPQTTTATAGQVVANGGVVDGLDLALPPDGVSSIVDRAIIHTPGSANAAEYEVRSLWARNGTGAPTQIGTTTATLLFGSGVTATFSHVANGNRIELQVTPGAAVTINYGIARTTFWRAA